MTAGAGPGAGGGEARTLHEAVAGLVARLGFGAVRAVERLSGGANQETYRIELADGGRLALRRAVHGSGDAFAGEMAMRGGVAAEALLLRAAAAAGVPVADVVHALTPEDGLGEGLLLEWLDGETVGTRIVRSDRFAEARRVLARECGAALARIHRIDTDPLRDVLPTVTPEQLVRDTWERYQRYGAHEPMIDYTARWLLDHLPGPRPPALVHGDFRNGNLMVGPTGLVGVLDWELAHLGDPMRDLGWMCTGSWRFGRHDLPVGGFGTREDLFAGYAAESGTPVDPQHVRFWEVFGSFWWAVGCLTMAEVYRTGVDRTVERLVIGRRSSECQWDCLQLLLPGPDERPGAPDPSPATGPPSAEELIAAVAEFLRGHVAPNGDPRTAYLAKVAANALDIARRQLVASDETNGRAALCAGLRSGDIALDAPGLEAYLRASVTAQLAIDQPGYGLA